MKGCKLICCVVGLVLVLVLVSVAPAYTQAGSSYHLTWSTVPLSMIE